MPIFFKIRDYLQLTKPSIMLLVLVTGAAALVLEGTLLSQPIEFALILVGLFLTGGCANALNQYLERELDGKMHRTRSRRPLPTGRIRPGSALAFAVIVGVLGVALLWFRFTPLSACIALATVLFYGFFYTLWLKPNTPHNIVIGGIAGAMAPVIAWAAATGTTSATAWLLFLIVFFWTPPHFWALALYLKEDYERVNLPMLPVVRGVAATTTQIYYYSLILVTVSLLVVFVRASPMFLYMTVASVLGAIFIGKSAAVRRDPTTHRQRSLFLFSILYLFVLFGALVVEGLYLT